MLRIRDLKCIEVAHYTIINSLIFKIYILGDMQIQIKLRTLPSCRTFELLMLVESHRQTFNVDVLNTPSKFLSWLNVYLEALDFCATLYSYFN